MSDNSVEQRYSFLQPYVKTGTGVCPVNHKSRTRATAKTVGIPPSGGANPAVFLNNSNPIVFKLNAVNLDIIKKWIIEFSIYNPEVANDYGLTSSHYFIQRIDVCLESSNVIESIRNYDLYCNELINIAATEAINGVRPVNFNYNFDVADPGLTITGIRPTTSTLNNGVTQLYYLDFNTCIDRAGVNWRIINSTNENKIEFRVYMNTAAGISASSTVNPAVNPQLTSIMLYGYGYELDVTEREAQMKAIKENSFNSLTTIHISNTYPINPPVANQKFTQVLNGISGTMCDIRAICAQTDPPQDGGGLLMYKYVPLTSINLVNQTGTSYLNASLSTQLQSQIDTYNYKKGSLSNYNVNQTNSQYIWKINLSPEPDEAEEGRPIGGRYITDWRVSGTFVANGQANRNYSLYVTAIQCCYVTIDKNLKLSVTTF